MTNIKAIDFGRLFTVPNPVKYRKMVKKGNNAAIAAYMQAIVLQNEKRPIGKDEGKAMVKAMDEQLNDLRSTMIEKRTIARLLFACHKDGTLSETIGEIQTLCHDIGIGEHFESEYEKLLLWLKK